MSAAFEGVGKPEQRTMCGCEREPHTCGDERDELIRRLEAERDAYRAMLCNLVAAAVDDAEVWTRARDLLKHGPATKETTDGE